MNNGLSAFLSTKVVNFEDAAFFRVPANWVVAEEEDGGLAIYEDRERSGTLRPWTAEYTFSDATPRDISATNVHDGQSFELLNDRSTFSYAVHDAEENGALLRLHQWLVAIRVSEDRLRVVTFTHSIEAASDGSDDLHWELQAIASAVRGAFYPDAVSD